MTDTAWFMCVCSNVGTMLFYNTMYVFPQLLDKLDDGYRLEKPHVSYYLRHSTASMYDVTNTISVYINIVKLMYKIPPVTTTIIITLSVHQEAQSIAIAELVSDKQHMSS